MWLVDPHRIALQRALRVRRRSLGMSIDELSARTRIERSRISRAERGYICLPDDERARIEQQLDEASS
jgi:ribosome-binding protein aMBF1 (putative translation factor)